MFGRKSKSKPRVITNSFEMVYDQKHNWWTFIYQNIEFTKRGEEILLPELQALDIYISWVGEHQKHIDEKVADMAKSWEDEFIDISKAHVASVEIEAPNRIAVMVLGDDTWGDLGYDLWIEDGKIINEGFAD